MPDERHEARWAGRPHKGDRVRGVRRLAGLNYHAEVIDTFYCNGDGGMHVKIDGAHSASWSHFSDWEVVR